MTNQPASALGRVALCVLLYLSFSIGHASAQDLKQTAITKDVNYAIGGYYECLPLDYKTSSKKYPLLIFIHGIGELGDGSQEQLPRILKNGVPKLIDRHVFPNSFTVNGQTSSFIVVSPQFRKNYRDADVVASLIDYCVSKYRVDESRIYLTGLSMGGGISWIYAAKSATYSKRLAAMLVIAGNTNSYSSGVASIATADLPVWITHNDGDPVVSVSNSLNWSKGLNGYSPAMSPKPILNIFSSDSHDAWTKTYDLNFKPNGLNVYQWMLSHSRKTAAPSNQSPEVDAGADVSLSLPENSVMLNGSATDADGSIASYKWTKVAGPAQGDITYPENAMTMAIDLVQGTYTFRLTAKDNAGATGYNDIKITVNAEANKPPVANAGTDVTLTLPLNSVKTAGEASDEDGSIASVEWSKVSGPASGTIENAKTAQAAINDLEEGTYVFRMTVTDNGGATASDDIKVTVNAAKPAIVRAGNDTLVYKNQTQPDTVFLNGAASEGGVKYAWRKISGPGTTSFDDSTALSTYAVGLQEGTHVFQLSIDGVASDKVNVVVRDWQRKNESPCRPGGGKSFIVSESYPGQYNRLYINRDNLLGEPVMGGDTLYFKGGKFTAFEIGDFGGGPGCPVYVMPKDQPIVITDGYFRIGVKDSNVVQHVVLDGTQLRSKGYPYGFFIDNRNTPAAENNYAGLVAGWVTDLTVKGYHSINTGIMQIKLDAKEELFGRYDKFVQKNIKIQDNFIDGSSAEGMYIGHTASNGGQLNNPYGPPPRMDSVEISDNIIINTNWDGIQLANARTAAIIRHNLVYKTGVLNQPSQRAGILMGANTTGIIDSNLVINSKGNGIQVFGYGAVKVHHNIVDSIYSGGGDQDGMYQSHIAVLPEDYNISLSVNNFDNLVSRVERKGIKVANNSGTMIPGHTYYNTFIDPQETDANNLITANASDALDHNQVVKSFPFHVNEVTTKGGNALISMTQGEATETFTNVKDVVDWLFSRLNGLSAANEAPIANAGDDRTITLPEDSTKLSGSGSDIDGSITSYNWKQLNGASDAVLKNTDSAKLNVSQLKEGSYEFELTVTDNGKAVGRDTVKITVKPVVVVTVENGAPEVYAGNNMQIKLPVNSVMLQGEATDEDGKIAATQWTKVSGPVSYHLQSDTALHTKAESLVEGVYKFELKATDNQNATTRDTIKITVLPAKIITPSNSAPIALAGTDQTIHLPTNKTMLVGAGADVDGTIEKYHWEKISGPTAGTVKNPNASATEVGPLKQGTYLFELVVTDNVGATTTDTVKVTVLAKANQAPLANAGADQTVQLPENSTILNGKGADEDGTIESYAWTQVSGPETSKLASASMSQSQLRSLQAGIYAFELKVTDDDGATGVDTVLINVKPAAVIANKAPVAYAGADVVIQLPTNKAILSGSGLDEDGTVKAYQWSQLDGPRGATTTGDKQAQATVSALVVGNYRFQLKVTDDAGASDVDTILVTVKAAVVVPTQAPVVKAGNDITLTLPVNKATLSGNVTDADGNVVSVQWTKISGSAQYTIAAPQVLQTEINNLAKGIYKFELRATDNKGAISRDTLQVTVVAPATRPMFVMNAGDDQTITLPTDSVELEGLVDDPYHTVKSYSWKKVSGPSQGMISDATASLTTVNSLVEGVYLFACTAKDENGNMLSDTVQVTVNVLEHSTVLAYPNPTPDILYLDIDANTRATNTMLTVYDLSGRVVVQETFVRNRGKMTKMLDVSKLKAGVYTIQIGTDINNTTALKFVKQ